jgi:hypothetical protein
MFPFPLLSRRRSYALSRFMTVIHRPFLCILCRSQILRTASFRYLILMTRHDHVILSLCRINKRCDHGKIVNHFRYMKEQLQRPFLLIMTVSREMCVE